MSSRMRTPVRYASTCLVLLLVCAGPAWAQAPTPDKPGSAPPRAVLPMPTEGGDTLLTLPLPGQVFRAESESAFLERLRRDAQGRKDKGELPKDAAFAPTRGLRRPLPPQAALSVPYVVCYRPLYYEDKNTDRYGWSLGGLQPFISTGRFFLDTALLPIHLVTQPPWTWECNSGYCLPGDPVPYLLYRHPWDGGDGPGRQGPEPLDATVVGGPLPGTPPPPCGSPARWAGGTPGAPR